MSGVVDGSSHKVLKLMRKPAPTLAVFWDYVSRTNNDNVAWPSVKTLCNDTGWGKTAIADARQWLVDHQALEPVTDYIRPQWREKTPQELTRLKNIDRSQYYRPTGFIIVEGIQYTLLYVARNQESDAPDSPEISHFPLGGKSVQNGQRAGTEIGPGGNELNTKRKALNTTTTKKPTESIDRSDQEEKQVVVTESDRTPQQQTADIESKALAIAKERLAASAASGDKRPNIFSFYENNIGIITPMMADTLRDAEKDYPSNWIQEAIEIAVENNARKWSYVSAILERWRSSGYDGKHKPIIKAATPNTVHLPAPGRACTHCGGAGFLLGENKQSVPCPECLAVEEKTHDAATA